MKNEAGREKIGNQDVQREKSCIVSDSSALRYTFNVKKKNTPGMLYI